MFDIERIRSDFPILAQDINQHPLAYLDNAATTQKPVKVMEVMNRYYETINANVHRSVHTLGEKATEAYEEARETVQHFIHAASRTEIVFVRGTTEAINLVAHSFLAPRVGPGDVILVTHMEHHSNIVPWQMICAHTGASMRVVPVTATGEIDLEGLKELLTEDACFLAITHVSNALGTINPIKEIIRLAHEHDVVVCVDGAQATPHLQVDVQDLDVDFYAFSGHKMYGPTGIGVLYAKAEVLEHMMPYQGGGEMIEHVDFEKTEYAPIPHKFEAGTPNIAGAIGLAAAIDYLEEIGLDVIAQREKELLKYATEKMQAIPGLRLIGTAENKVPVLSFALKEVHSHDIGTILNSLGIAIRSGHHCAMPLMDFLEVPGTARASLAFYNTEAEVDRLVAALATVEEVMGNVRPT